MKEKQPLYHRVDCNSTLTPPQAQQGVNHGVQTIAVWGLECEASCQQTTYCYPRARCLRRTLEGLNVQVKPQFQPDFLTLEAPWKDFIVNYAIILVAVTKKFWSLSIFVAFVVFINMSGTPITQIHCCHFG